MTLPETSSVDAASFVAGAAGAKAALILVTLAHGDDAMSVGPGAAAADVSLNGGLLCRTGGPCPSVVISTLVA